MKQIISYFFLVTVIDLSGSYHGLKNLNLLESKLRISVSVISREAT